MDRRGNVLLFKFVEYFFNKFLFYPLLYLREIFEFLRFHLLQSQFQGVAAQVLEFLFLFSLQLQLFYFVRRLDECLERQCFAKAEQLSYLELEAIFNKSSQLSTIPVLEFEIDSRQLNECVVWIEFDFRSIPIH